MKVPLLDLQKAYQELKPEFDQLWQNINHDAFYILGNRLSQFEQEFAKYLGVKHVIGVGDGLDALTLSLKALNIGKGDEVIVPAFTFIATWLAVSEAGATPIGVEVNEDFLIDPEQIKKAITPKTKAIMPVHLYGKVCDMEKIMAIAKEHHLKVIEDSAQAHGGFTKQHKAGAFGDCSGFSFYPGKNLGCFGDGGCISTNDDALAEKLHMLRNYGSKVSYEHTIKAGNSRLDELQAGVLSIKLKKLDEWNKRRRKIAKIYLQELQGISDLLLPRDDDGHVWHLFSIRTSKRDALQKFLTSKDIGTKIHYPKAIHLQNAYAEMNIKEDAFPLTERMCKEQLSLPMGPHLAEEEAHYCAKAIREFFAHA
ncbi:MAG TPA: DegT/DnrJ/EryC1/StrS family aminotransferase [Gammaproteobacteria bacterium]|nr:DegT/DnrJ/EryC1/StrS family aminotransferase [Gammaproteobacteria bacterium]